MKRSHLRFLLALGTAMALLLCSCTSNGGPSQSTSPAAPVEIPHITMTAAPVPMTQQHDKEWYWDNYIADMVYPMQGNYPSVLPEDLYDIKEYCATKYGRLHPEAVVDREVRLPHDALLEYANRYFGIDAASYDFKLPPDEDPTHLIYCEALFNDLTGVYYDDWAFQLLSAEEFPEEGLVKVRVGRKVMDESEMVLYPDGYDSCRDITLVHTGNDQFALQKIEMISLNTKTLFTVSGHSSSIAQVSNVPTYQLNEPSLNLRGNLLMALDSPDSSSRSYLEFDPATGEPLGYVTLPEEITSTDYNSMLLAPHYLNNAFIHILSSDSHLYFPSQERLVAAKPNLKKLLAEERFLPFSSDLELNCFLIFTSASDVLLYQMEQDMLTSLSEKIQEPVPLISECRLIGNDLAYLIADFSSTANINRQIYLYDIAKDTMQLVQQEGEALVLNEHQYGFYFTDAEHFYLIRAEQTGGENSQFITLFTYSRSNLSNPISVVDFEVRMDNLFNNFYPLPNGEVLLITQQFKEADWLYQAKLLNLQTGELRDTDFSVQSHMIDPDIFSTMLTIQYLGMAEDGVGIFNIISTTDFPTSRMVTAKLYDPQ